MSTQPLSFDAIRSFVSLREVDLVLSASPPSFSLALRGQFDGHGDFFTIFASDVEYVEMLGGLTVGDLVLSPDVERALALSQKWAWLRGIVSGPALVIRSADSESWDSTSEGQLFLVVANGFVVEAGSDWDAELRRLKPSPPQSA